MDPCLCRFDGGLGDRDLGVGGIDGGLRRALSGLSLIDRLLRRETLADELQ